jgi:hypothetical protein
MECSLNRMGSSALLVICACGMRREVLRHRCRWRHHGSALSTRTAYAVETASMDTEANAPPSPNSTSTSGLHGCGSIQVPKMLRKSSLPAAMLARKQHSATLKSCSINTASGMARITSACSAARHEASFEAGGSSWLRSRCSLSEARKLQAPRIRPSWGCCELSSIPFRTILLSTSD